MAASASLCPRCQSDFSHKCINCGGYMSVGAVAKLCGGCKYGTGCAKCGEYVSSGATARLCPSCRYQFSTRCFKCGGYAS